MKKKTSSGGEIHFGNMKGCAESTFIADFEATMVIIPYASDHSPLQW